MNYRILIVAEIAEPTQHFEILQRMDVACDRQCEGTDARACHRIAGQQPRFGVRLLQPLANRQRLRQDAAPTIQLQRGQQPLGVQAQILGLALLVPAQVMERMLGAQLLQVQRDPHAVPSRSIARPQPRMAKQYNLSIQNACRHWWRESALSHTRLGKLKQTTTLPIRCGRIGSGGRTIQRAAANQVAFLN